MAQAPAPVRAATIVDKRRLTPHMTRLALSGPDLEDLPVGAFTDHYVKLLLPPRGAPYDAAAPVERVRRIHPPALWPKSRTYTVRAWDAACRRLTLDVVVHGDAGVAGPWIAGAEVGDTVQLRGPGGSFRPNPEAAWHLLAGDLSALPAIAVAVERLPPGARAVAVVELEDDADRQELASVADLDLRWVAARGGPRALAEHLAAATLPAGVPCAFVHGEAGVVKAVRDHLLGERGVPVAQLSASAYWKRRRTDEQRRAEAA